MLCGDYVNLLENVFDFCKREFELCFHVFH